MVKQVSTLVAVKKLAPEAPGTTTPTINSKKTALKRQIIICKLSVASVVRTIQVNVVLKDDGEQQTDLDSHVGTFIIDQHALIVHDFNFQVNVVGYDPSKGITTLNCQTVSTAVAYDCPMTG